MEAYKKKDPAGMLALMSSEPSQNRAVLEDAVKEGPAGEAHQEVFNPEMLAIMTGPNAKVEGPRYDHEGRPTFKVSQDATDTYVLSLAQANGKWSVDQLDLMSNEDFQALPTKPAS
jgi:hypothetical protein